MKATTFKIQDRGAVGHGRKLFHLKRGALGVKFTQSARVRRSHEAKLARRYGEKRVVSKLIALEVLNKRVNPALAAKARADAHYIAGSFVGSRRVNYPSGFKRKP